MWWSLEGQFTRPVLLLSARRRRAAAFAEVAFDERFVRELRHQVGVLAARRAAEEEWWRSALPQVRRTVSALAREVDTASALPGGSDTYREPGGRS